MDFSRFARRHKRRQPPTFPFRSNIIQAYILAGDNRLGRLAEPKIALQSTFLPLISFESNQGRLLLFLAPARTLFLQDYSFLRSHPGVDGNKPLPEARIIPENTGRKGSDPARRGLLHKMPGMEQKMLLPRWKKESKMICIKHWRYPNEHGFRCPLLGGD